VSPEGPPLDCDPGYAPIQLSDGTWWCIWVLPPVGEGSPSEPVKAPGIRGPAYPLPPKPTPTPPAPVQPAPRPPAQPIAPRQPGAPAAPYNPPGRIGLWPGPIFNPVAGASATASSASTTEIGGAVLGEGPIFVNVNNATNLADNSASNAVQSVAQAVQAGINAATQQASSIANQTQVDISAGLLDTTSAITSSVHTVFDSLLNGLTDINNSVGNALGDIGTTIGNDLVGTISPVTQLLTIILNTIAQNLNGLASKVAQAVAVIIPQIVAAVANPIGAVKDVLVGIENEIGNNLASLVKIPGAIADSATSLDASLQRILFGYERFVESQTGYPDGGNTHTDLSAIVKALAGLTQYISGGTNPKLSDDIKTSLCQSSIQDYLNTPYLDKSGDTGYIADVAHAVGKSIVQVLSWLIHVLPAAQKVIASAGQDIDKACPIETLPPNVLVDAVLRGFLPYGDAADEAAKGNLNDSRFTLLKDLATHQLAPAELVEALYRGIIPQADYASALSAQGWTAGQQSILQALGVSLLTVAESLDLYRRGTIDRPTLAKILAAHQYDSSQQDAIASLAFRPPNFTEAVAGTAASEAFLALGTAVGPQVFTPPEYAEAAAAAEGLDPSASAQRWLNHWNTGSFGVWTTLFFRGQITLQTLQAIAGREFIPGELIPAFVEAQRPLVQFRTISTMLRLKLIAPDTARVLLRQHGYSEDNITLLIGYAQRPAPTPAAKNAQALHSASLGIAKEEYIDGSITADQYLAILTQHGYSVDGANTELQVVNAHQALLRRKELTQLVIDEYGAGLIDEQAALAQLALLGLTVEELARAAHKIRAFRGKNAKHPTESDLHHFLVNGLITNDEYVAELVAQGYSQKWAADFLAYRQLATSPGSASTVQSPPTSTGG
jgi:hypothetical protein